MGAEQIEDLSIDTIGRYEVLGKLAVGGMAEILLGRLTGPSGFERAVAIKRILPTLAEQQSFVDMFLDEARIAARINHPNVVHYQELGREEGQLFLVMEYLEGESLASLMRRARSRNVEISYPEAMYVIAEAAAGLHAAHEMTDVNGVPLGIVHRDISPQNVFVTYDGSVKVMDFGIAKAANRITVTEAGSLKGKFEYMSPEQATGDAIDHRSDIFSLGIVLYELTTGRRLFRRATPVASLAAVRDAEIIPPSLFIPDYPRELERILKRALAPLAKDRYPHAKALRHDLLRACGKMEPEGLPGEGLRQSIQRLFADRIIEKREMLRRVSGGSPVTAVPQAEVDIEIELPSVEFANPKKAAPGRTAGIMIVMLCAVAGGSWWLWSRSQQPSAPSPPETTATPNQHETIADPASDPPALDSDPSIQLTVESIPSGAELAIDGSPRGRTPFTLELPESNAELELRLSLDGHEDSISQVTPDVDQRLRLSLRPVRRGPPSMRPRMHMTTMPNMTNSTMDEFPVF